VMLRRFYCHWKR